MELNRCMEPCVSCFISAFEWNMCENHHYELVYFIELHNDHEYYCPTTYRAGAAVVSTTTVTSNCHELSHY